ncbi:FAD-dependent monooxygenase [Conexibacter sp. SYSU D00693]|uniref:FAD-dependent monooxygenase n=1 Tax=Conexibacter sp. SYSU D00693 TaxID=2812560 RepID=UPI00196AACE3|nr:FAD-dependent monooxygenase [Conexibacter sp. SYSU D00693]
MIEHEVVVVGGGPTGHVLAAELALAGVDVGVLERRGGTQLESARARGLQARTIEVLDQRGIADRFLAEGERAQIVAFAGRRLDLTGFPTRHPYGLALTQDRIEAILGAWVEELPVALHRRREVTGFAQDVDGVTVDLADGERVRARYLVGCDGARSLVRKTAGIAFEGWDASTSMLQAEVEMTGEPVLGVQHDEHGTYAIGPLGDGRFGVVVREPDPTRGGQPTLEDLRAELVAVFGTDFGLRRADWVSRFTDASLQAAAYRDRRVLLAGDAAHIHSPIGGQGLGTGVQDAVNLGWKLAEVVHGTAPDALLDTYEAERRPVGARVLRTTMALTALQRVDDRMDALREKVVDLLDAEESRTRLAAELSGLDVRYDLGGDHPLVGRRMPDLDLVTEGGEPTRVFALLHDARPLLLDLGGGLDGAPRPERARVVAARAEGPWELPVVGEVLGPGAVLVRPDGHVAWVA